VIEIVRLDSLAAGISSVPGIVRPSCINSAVPVYDISKLLGHSSQATTARYAHLRDDRLLAAANAVGTMATGGAADE